MRASRPCFSFVTRCPTPGRPALRTRMRASQSLSSIGTRCPTPMLPTVRSRTRASQHATDLLRLADLRPRLGCAAELRAQATFGLDHPAAQTIHLGCEAEHRAQATLRFRPLLGSGQSPRMRSITSGAGHSPQIRGKIFVFTKIFDNNAFDSKFRLHEGLRQQVPPGLRPFTSASQQNSYSH